MARCTGSARTRCSGCRSPGARRTGRAGSPGSSSSRDGRCCRGEVPPYHSCERSLRGQGAGVKGMGVFLELTDARRRPRRRRWRAGCAAAGRRPAPRSRRRRPAAGLTPSAKDSVAVPNMWTCTSPGWRNSAYLKWWCSRLAKAVAHVGLARQERLLPDHRAAAPDAARCPRMSAGRSPTRISGPKHAGRSLEWARKR